MPSSRKLPPSAKGKLGRSQGKLAQLPKILAVCEGKTEHDLLQGLRARHRIANALIVIEGEVGSPRTVVARAIALRAENFGQMAKGDPARQKLQAWAVFDRDEHETWQEALDRARTVKPPILLAISNPCAELWAILLHRDQSAEIHRHTAQSELAKIHSGYDHDAAPTFNLEVCLEVPEPEAEKPQTRLQIAADRAERLRKRRADADDVDGNPSTTLHLLIAELLQLPRPVQNALTATAARPATTPKSGKP